MKLQFERYDYQTEAVDSIVNIFKGQPIKSSNFTVSTGGLLTQGIGNDLELFDDELLENIKQIQMSNGLPKSSSIQGKNFTVEMETGTGKTFVYIKTIFELNKKYGFTKFIIVVPSIAIKEGVYKSIQTMEEFFMNDYNNVSFNYKIYDSQSPEQIENFATTTNIEILIINISSFVKDLGEENKKSNLIHRASDKLAGMKPIELIRKTNPIVIIDEPQSVDNTDKAKYAIESLNPSFVLRYSATHREKYNYHNNLVV
jgi:type III restriction enzyme